MKCSAYYKLLRVYLIKDYEEIMLWKNKYSAIERNINSLIIVVNEMSLRYSTNPIGYRNGAGVQ